MLVDCSHFFAPHIASSTSIVLAEGALYYLKDSTELQPNDLVTLQSVACDAKATGNRVTLEGNASSDEKHPDQLSLRRAIDVKDRLIRHGVHSDQIAIAAYGVKRPTVSNELPEGRALNRVLFFSAGPVSSGECSKMIRSFPRT